MDVYKKKKQKNPLKRMGTADDVANLVSELEKLVEKNENFTEKDFEYGIKVLNACMERKAKEVGGSYTLVIKPLERE